MPRTGRVQITITGRRRPSLDGKSGRHPGLSQRQARQSSKGEGPQRQTQSPILVTGATQDAALGRARVLVAANLTVVTLQNAHEFLGQLLFRRHPGGFFGGLERDLHVVVVADGLDGGLAGRRRSSVAGSFSSLWPIYLSLFFVVPFSTKAGALMVLSVLDSSPIPIFIYCSRCEHRFCRVDHIVGKAFNDRPPVFVANKAGRFVW